MAYDWKGEFFEESPQQEQKRLLLSKSLLENQLVHINKRLVELNRPKHIDAKEILATLAAREATRTTNVRRERKSKFDESEYIDYVWLKYTTITEDSL